MGPSGCKGDCTIDTDCQAGSFCAAGICVAKYGNGHACGLSSQCASTRCVDGVCCDTACTAQCQACDVKGSIGTCTTVPEGQPHAGRFRCDGTGICQAACAGTIATGCTFPGATKLCAAPTCEDGVQSSAGTCNGTGQCGHPTTSECSPYACGVTSCRTACAQPSDCARGFDCIGSTCVSLEAGAPIVDDGALEATLDANVDASTADVSVVTDAAGRETDASDARVATLDAGDASVGSDARAPDGSPAESDGAALATDAELEGSCGCTVPGGRDARTLPGFAMGALVLGIAVNRRRRHASRAI